MWSLYYADGSVVTGTAQADWDRAPLGGVQVLVLWELPPLRNGVPYRVWRGVSDRQLWTGLDEYELNGWDVKYGQWMDWDAYLEIWERAAYGPHHP